MNFISHICAFSRCMLNVRSTRSHPTLAPRPQICLIGGNGFCAVAGEGELNRRRGFGDRSWCLLLTREWLGIGGWFDLTILYWSKKEASILLFNLYNFNLNAKHLFTIISEQAENFYSLPQIPVTTIWFKQNPAKDSPRREPIPYICGLGARFGCERFKRTFKPPRLKSQICFI